MAVFDVESGLIHTVLPRVFHNSGSGFLVSPDAREIIMLGRDLEDRLGLFAINRDSGEVRRLVASETPDEIGLDFEWPSRDGPIYYQERKSTRQRIIGLDPESLERETIYETSPGDPVVGRFSVSHDGGWFAFVESRYAPGQTPSTTHFLRVLRRDNPVSEQFELPGSVSHPGLAWSEDDSVVAFILDRRIWKEVEGRMESERAGEEYWRVPMDGGAPIVTALSLPEGYRAHGIHLETGRISVYVGGEQTPRELWVLENFLPPEK